MKIKQVFLIIYMLIYSVHSHAVDYQTHTSIEKKAISFLRLQLTTHNIQDLQIQLRPLDKRLKLERCSTPLQASLPYNISNHTNTSVSIQCLSGNGWKIFVSAKIKNIKNIYINQNTIKKGQFITVADLSLKKTDINTLRNGYFTHTDKLIGNIAVRNIRANSILTPHMIEKPNLIHKGDRVTLLVSKRGFEVRMQGQAMTHGGAGEHIRVRALSSKRVIEGIIVSPGVVRVSFL